jgi:hypothetical protein
MPTEVGAQTVIHIRYRDVWLNRGLRRYDGLFALFPLPIEEMGRGSKIFDRPRHPRERGFLRMTTLAIAARWRDNAHVSEGRRLSG